ncbi:hypothetical protein ACFE04_011269 [Oxalis oulophora]
MTINAPMQLRGIKRVGSSAPYEVAPRRGTSSFEDLPIAQGKKSRAKHPSLGCPFSSSPLSSEVKGHLPENDDDEVDNEENDPDFDENNSEDQHSVEQFHEDRFSQKLQALSKIYLSQALRGVTTL